MGQQLGCMKRAATPAASADGGSPDVSPTRPRRRERSRSNVSVSQDTNQNNSNLNSSRENADPSDGEDQSSDDGSDRESAAPPPLPDRSPDTKAVLKGLLEAMHNLQKTNTANNDIMSEGNHNMGKSKNGGQGDKSSGSGSNLADNEVQNEQGNKYGVVPVEIGTPKKNEEEKVREREHLKEAVSLIADTGRYKEHEKAVRAAAKVRDSGNKKEEKKVGYADWEWKEKEGKNIYALSLETYCEYIEHFKSIGHDVRNATLEKQVPLSGQPGCYRKVIQECEGVYELRLIENRGERKQKCVGTGKYHVERESFRVYPREGTDVLRMFQESFSNKKRSIWGDDVEERKDSEWNDFRGGEHQEEYDSDESGNDESDSDYESDKESTTGKRNSDTINNSHNNSACDTNVQSASITNLPEPKVNSKYCNHSARQIISEFWEKKTTFADAEAELLKRLTVGGDDDSNYERVEDIPLIRGGGSKKGTDAVAAGKKLPHFTTLSQYKKEKVAFLTRASEVVESQSINTRASLGIVLWDVLSERAKSGKTQLDLTVNAVSKGAMKNSTSLKKLNKVWELLDEEYVKHSHSEEVEKEAKLEFRALMRGGVTGENILYQFRLLLGQALPLLVGEKPNWSKDAIVREIEQKFLNIIPDIKSRYNGVKEDAFNPMKNDSHILDRSKYSTATGEMKWILCLGLVQEVVSTCFAESLTKVGVDDGRGGNNGGKPSIGKHREATGYDDGFGSDSDAGDFREGGGDNGGDVANNNNGRNYDATPTNGNRQAGFGKGRGKGYNNAPNSDGSRETRRRAPSGVVEKRMVDVKGELLEKPRGVLRPCCGLDIFDLCFDGPKECTRSMPKWVDKAKAQAIIKDKTGLTTADVETQAEAALKKLRESGTRYSQRFADGLSAREYARRNKGTPAVSMTKEELRTVMPLRITSREAGPVIELRMEELAGCLSVLE
jgi:hypothetical protein